LATEPQQGLAGRLPFIVSSVRTCGLHSLPLLARTASRTPLRGKLPGLINHVPTQDGVALTFDDGPGPRLDGFLAALERSGATATFFLVGEQVARDPGRAAAIVQAGHEVGVHGYQHRPHLHHWPDDTVEDMRRARGVIEEAIGRRTQYFRPPHGVFCLASWRECDRQGWERVLWTRAAWDWEASATARSIADRVGTPLAGDILLLHDADRYCAPESDVRTLEALPIVLDRISAAGLRARSLGNLLG
jgi:peptidoglycan/xylan/chitin deacetylase (PgdA/CDA1 family)